MHPTLVCSRIPICASLSKFADHFVPMLHIQGSLPPTLSPATADIVRLKLKEHIHTTSIYTELCFICYKISPLVFFLLCRYCLLYTSHERLMILNLACFKAFSSSIGRAVQAVADVVRSTLRTATTARARDHQPAYGFQLYFYHNYIYIDSCFSFPFIRFAVVPCSNVSVLCSCVCFFM